MCKLINTIYRTNNPFVFSHLTVYFDSQRETRKGPVLEGCGGRGINLSLVQELVVSIF